MKNQLLKTMLLLFALIAGSSSTWADTYTLQLSSSKKYSASGLTDGSIVWSATNNSASIGNWSNDYNGQQFGTSSTQGNVVLSTSSITGTITQVDVYSQTGTSGGAKVAVSVDGTSWGEKTMKVPTATKEDPGLLTFTGSESGTIEITLTQTKKKALYLNKIVITYTPSSTQSSAVSFASATPSIDWPTNPTYTQTATTASGYATTAGASVTYSIGSANTAAATINASTGEVTPTKGGSVQVVATAAAIDGKYTQSTASYTLTVNDVRSTATLAWSESSVEIFKDASSYSLPTLNNPNSLPVTYSATGTAGLASVTSEGVVTVNTGTVGTATIKASFEGNMTYKPRTATYTIEVVDPTVKGSKYNPYTVAEVRAVSTSTTIADVYIKGYVVGFVHATYDFTTDASLFTNSNWAIADAKDETDKDKTAPVQISSSYQEKYGLKDRPYHIGAQVLMKGDITKYFGISGIKNLDELSILSVNATIPSSGYSTLATPYNLDHLKSPSGELEAYVVTAVTSTAATLESIPHIPAGTGIILKGTAGTSYDIPVYEHGYVLDKANKLQAALLPTPVNANEVYVLKDGLFHKVTNASTVPAGKAYLLASDVSASELLLDFNGGSTGIANTNLTNNTNNGVFYDLQGRKVVNPTKGLYIVNGKKVVIK